MRRFLVDAGGGLALAVLGLYVWVAPAHIVSGDNAEFSALSALGGAAHPPGYPAYVLWLRLWSWLPLDTPAHVAAVATAICTALQTLSLQAAARAWGARPIAASTAAALFAVGPIVLRVQSEAEVFAPHSLICALVLWLAATRGPLRGWSRVFALGLVAGLGIANQLTCVLLAPVGVYGVVLGIREAPRAARVIAAGVGGLALGLSTYGYLLIAPNSWVAWSNITSATGLWRHFLRMDYGGPGAFMPRGYDVPVADNLAALARTIGRTLAWAPAVVGLAGLGWFVARPRGETRAGWIALAASWLLAGPLLVARFNIGLDDIGISFVQRFHLMPALLLVVPLAVALDAFAARWVPARVAAWGLARQAVLAVLVPLAVVLALAPRSLAYVAPAHSFALERSLDNLLETQPPDAIVVSDVDVVVFGFGYLQGALGERQDVVLISGAAIAGSRSGSTDLRARIAARSGIAIDAAHADVGAVLRLAMATQRPVFIDELQVSAAAPFTLEPYGSLFRVLPAGTPPPSAVDVYEANRTLFDRFVFDYPPPGPHDEFATWFHGNYARTWRRIARELLAAGRADLAADAAARAEALEPGPEEP